MSPATLFQIANLLPLPVWAIWIVAPRSRPARALARSIWPWGLLAHGLDPRAFSTLAGVMKLFAQPWVALAGWVHYLCFDLFVARWIMNDAPDAGYWLTPILFLTLMFGPVGLLCYLAVRGPLGFDR